MTEQAYQDFIFGLQGWHSSQHSDRSAGICFAARRAGLELSLDGGQTWQSAYASLTLAEPLETTCVALSPDFEIDHTLFAGVKGSVLRSQDAGQTWQAIRLPTPPPTIVALLPSPAYRQDGLLFAATLQDGVFRSTNRGANWNAWNFGLLDGNLHCLALSPQFAQDGTLYAGTQSGIFQSTNRGQGWRAVAFPADLAPVLSLAISAGTGDLCRLYAGTEAGLYLSEDRGQTWQAQAPDRLTGAIEQIVLDGEAGLVLQDGAVWFTASVEQRWTEQQFSLDGAEISAVSAPAGLANGAPLWLALTDGRVLCFAAGW